MGFAVIWSSCHSDPLICQTILLDVTSVFWKHPTICFVFIIRNNVGWHFKSWVRNPVFWQSQGWKIKQLTSITWHRQELKDMAWQVGGLLGAFFTVRLGMLYFTFSRWEVMIWFDMIYLLTAIVLSPGGRSTVHVYTQTIHRTIQNKQ